VSRQAFPRKIGKTKKVRGMSETQGYCNVRFACSVYMELGLSIAGTHSQPCIVDYKYRYAAGKKDFLIGLLIWHGHTHIFISKRHLPE